MQYAYEKLMQEYELSHSELPEDAKLGIEAIKNIEKAVNMAEKSGKKINPQTMAKIKANDKWVVREILDYVDDDDKNAEEMPFEDDEIIDDINKANNPEKELGFSIESELENMFKSGKKEFDLNEVKGVAPNTYKVLFDNFDEDDDNGVETNRYKLIETDEEIFTISKK